MKLSSLNGASSQLGIVRQLVRCTRFRSQEKAFGSLPMLTQLMVAYGLTTILIVAAPGGSVQPDNPAEQAQKAISTKSKKKFVDLDKALKQVPLLDPELKAKVIEKIQVACDAGQKKAANALNELIATGRAFDIPISSNNGKRPFAGVSRTAPNEPSISA
jgi:hypothetical protein